jgi:hypothetical protein
MRIQTEQERQAAERTLKEVMQKLEEALRLSRERDAQHEDRCTMAGSRG